jgi:Protein of unknown function (DUF3421)
VKWVPASDGKLPDKAVQGGRLTDGGILYIGRVLYRGSLLPGSIDPKEGALFAPYNGVELKFANYEQMVYI